MKASETEKLCASILAHERDQERTADCAKRFVSWLAGDTFEHTCKVLEVMCGCVCVAWHTVSATSKIQGKVYVP